MTKLVKKFQPGGYAPIVPSYRWQDNVSEDQTAAIDATLKADQLANQTQIPLAPLAEAVAAQRNADIYNKQAQLKALGFYTKKVDGKWGSGSKNAEAAALKAGYTWNGFTYSKPQLEAKQNDSGHHALTIGEEGVLSAWNDFKSSLKNSQLLEHPLGSTLNIGKSALKLGYNTGKDVFFEYTPTGQAISYGVEHMYDNMYPYSYGDKLVNNKTGEITTYTGGEIPQGWTLKQVSASDDPLVQGWAAASKIGRSVVGMDPRRAIMNQLADIDLSTEEGRNLWNSLAQEAQKNNMVFFNGHTNLTPEQIQWYTRARLDNMSMYKDGTMKYNTYEVNPEYESNTAKSRHAKTYRIADPVMRNKINQEMANYWLKNAKTAKWVKEGDANYKNANFKITKDGKYVMQNMGYLGNQAMVADDINGTNLVNGDWWDYIIDDPNARAFYTADRIVPEGQRPQFTGRTGLNHAHMTEVSDDLVDKIWEASKQKAINNIHKYRLQEKINDGYNRVKRLIARN